MLALALLMLVFTPGSVLALNQVDHGFDLNELVRLSGAGDDPGTADLRARLDWAVMVATPPDWRAEVPVIWQIGHAGSGHLAVSYKEGRSVLSPRVIGGSAELLLSTVAHEMGHQIAFQMVEPFNGYPPQGFIDRAGDYFFHIREGWADCVSRVFTGSRQHTLSESRGCPDNLAHYTATLIDDPAKLRPKSKSKPSPPPRPSPTRSPSPSPSPVLSPIEHPLISDYASPTPSPSPTVKADSAPAPGAESFPRVLLVLIGVIVIAVVAAGKFISRVPNERLVEWASGSRAKPRGEGLVSRLRKKISRHL